MMSINLKPIEKAMDKAGMHVVCTIGIHDYNKKRKCRKCGKVENNER